MEKVREKRKKKEKGERGRARPVLTSICLVTVYRYEG